MKRWKGDGDWWDIDRSRVLKGAATSSRNRWASLAHGVEQAAGLQVGRGASRCLAGGQATEPVVPRGAWGKPLACRGELESE